MLDMSVWATSLLAAAYSVGFVFFFSLSPSYVALWDSKTPHRPTCERISYCLETSPSWLPPQDGSLSLTLLSLFLSFIFCYLLSKGMGCLSGCLVSSASVQKLFHGSCSALIKMIFWWICGGESGLPLLFLPHLGTAPVAGFNNDAYI